MIQRTGEELGEDQESPANASSWPYLHARWAKTCGTHVRVSFRIFVKEGANSTIPELRGGGQRL